MVQVLVVDDRPDVRLSFLYMLQAIGYDVAEACDGYTALEYMQSKPVDVLLTDLFMPGMDGVGLVETVINTPRRRPALVVMTGEPPSKTSRRLEAARRLGVQVLEKPITRDQLESAIKRAAQGLPAATAGRK